METPKRKYQKHKTESKVSVHHYLNTALKVKIVDGKSVYPLYVRVRVKDKSNYLKSDLNKYLAKDEFEQFQLTNKADLANEVNSITSRVNFLVNLEGDDFSFSLLREYSETLFQVVTDTLKKLMLTILVLESSGAKQYNENTELLELDDSLYAMTLENYRQYKFVIDWKSNTYDHLLETLPDMFNSSGLRLLRSKFINNPSFYEVYSSLSEKYYSGVATLNDWLNGDFKDKMKLEYSFDNQVYIMNEYINLIDSLLLVYSKTSKNNGL